MNNRSRIFILLLVVAVKSTVYGDKLTPDSVYSDRQTNKNNSFDTSYKADRSKGDETLLYPDLDRDSLSEEKYNLREDLFAEKYFTEDNVILDQPEINLGLEPENKLLFTEDNLSEFDETQKKQPKLFIYRDKRIDSYINVYLSRYRERLKKGLERGKYYIPIFKKIFKSYNLPEELVYLSIVESNINPKAISRARATGIWQFMKHTGLAYGLTVSWWEDQRKDPIKSTHAAARHLRDLYAKYANWELALAAYNAGSGKVSRAIRANLRKNKPINYSALSLPRETRYYVPQFMAVVTIMKNPEKYGLDASFTKFNQFEDYRSIKVPGGVSFEQISKKLDIPISKLKLLNSHYFHGFTPLNNRSSQVRIPVVSQVSDTQIKQLKKDLYNNWIRHKVRGGDSLWSISRRYQISVSQIKAANPSLRNRRYLKVGINLMIPGPEFNPQRKTALRSQAQSDKRFVYHKVKKGESLFIIARRYGVNMRKIIEANKNVKNINDIIQVGMQLLIPTKA